VETNQIVIVGVVRVFTVTLTDVGCARVA
jgi:hypothetical protein